VAKQPSPASGNGGAPAASEPSFKTKIAPLFTAEDYGCMITHSRYNDWDPVLDLRDYDSVKQWADEIYHAVRGGLMPKDPQEGRWSPATVALFKSWIDNGFPP
jgi:hypothetical protein